MARGRGGARGGARGAGPVGGRGVGGPGAGGRGGRGARGRGRGGGDPGNIALPHVAYYYMCIQPNCGYFHCNKSVFRTHYRYRHLRHNLLPKRCTVCQNCFSDRAILDGHVALGHVGKLPMELAAALHLI